MNIKKFGWALLFSFAASNLFFTNNTFADLEPINSKDQKFSAWCNFPKNKCKVTINDGKLIIDKHLGGKGIFFNDIFTYEKFEEEHQLSNYRKKPDLVWVHQFEYQKSDGSFSTTKIMFNNKKSDNRFSAAINSSI